MPEIWVLGLISSFLLLAIGSTLKAAEALHSLKLSNNEVTSLRKQIAMLEQEKQELTLNASKSNSCSENEILKNHNINPEKETMVFTSNESPKIAPGIQVKTEFKKTGWYCVLKDVICMEHNRTLQPDNISNPYEYTCKAAGCKVKIKSPLISFAKNEAKDLTEAHIRTNFNIEPKKTNRLR